MASAPRTPKPEVDEEAAAPELPAVPTVLTESPDADFVPARWVHPQAQFSPAQGLIRYGDPFWVTVEQLEQDARLIAWSPEFVPNPTLLTISRQEG